MLGGRRTGNFRKKARQAPNTFPSVATFNWFDVQIFEVFIENGGALVRERGRAVILFFPHDGPIFSNSGISQGGRKCLPEGTQVEKGILFQ